MTNAWTRSQRIVEVTAILLLVVMWSFTIAIFPTLHETIPTHYDFTGTVNQYGSRLTIFLMPGIGTLM